MTKKRFVKLLMSKGVSRNEANNIAKGMIKTYGNYKSGYRMWKLSTGYRLSDISDALQKATTAIGSIVDALCASVKAFSSALTVSLQNPSPLGGKCRRCGGNGVERQMQSMAQIGGPSVRGPDKLTICSRCLGTGREVL